MYTACNKRRQWVLGSIGKCTRSMHCGTRCRVLYICVCVCMRVHCMCRVRGVLAVHARVRECATRIYTRDLFFYLKSRVTYWRRYGAYERARACASLRASLAVVATHSHTHTHTLTQWRPVDQEYTRTKVTPRGQVDHPGSCWMSASRSVVRATANRSIKAVDTHTHTHAINPRVQIAPWYVGAYFVGIFFGWTVVRRIGDCALILWSQLYTYACAIACIYYSVAR